MSVCPLHPLHCSQEEETETWELGAWEACRDRPLVGWEVRQGEVVSGEQTLDLMVLGAEGGLGLADRV